MVLYKSIHVTLHVHCTWGKSSINFCIICAFLSTFQTWNFSPPVSDFKQSSWHHVNLFFLIKLRIVLIIIIDWFVKLHNKSPVLSQYKLLALLLILLSSHKTQSFSLGIKVQSSLDPKPQTPITFPRICAADPRSADFCIVLFLPRIISQLLQMACQSSLKLFPMPLLPLLLLLHYYTVTYQAASEPPGMRDGPYLAPSSPPLTPLPTNRRPLDSSSLQRLCGQKRWKNGMVIL